MHEVTIPLFERAKAYAGRTAIVATEGEFTYQDLLSASGRVASSLLGREGDLREARVAFMAPAGYHYVATQWGVWRAGGIAVPLKVSSPAPQLEYVVDDSQAALIVAHPEFEAALRPIAEKRGVPFLLTTDALRGSERRLPDLSLDRRAMILYTSGTTSQPKGAVTTHRNIQAQVTSLVEAWEWRQDDRIPLFLPLDHIHGIINILTCALWSGAVCEMMPRFEAEKVWDRLLKGGLTLFMAVPDIYTRLIAAWHAAPPERQRAMSSACQNLRLMVSGSSALPVPRLEEWKKISGHVLLERYGMTEIGMALSNPLHGERRPGFVGMPLPGVEVRLMTDEGAAAGRGEDGEIQVRGPNVFQEYWDRPDQTRESFRDGWFLTGDIARVENGSYRILGRKSTDIIKSGGEKVSALVIEPVLLQHPDIVDCAVVGVEDPRWGEAVCAVVVLRGGAALTRDSLREWAKQRLSPAEVPTRLLVLDELPRNAMRKVTKPALVKMFAQKG